jgi:DNA (cytosine-5)-methyltransferase 1
MKTPTPAALKAWRAKHGLTQREAGAFAYVRLRSWQKWEYGERPVPHWLRAVLRETHGTAP